MKQSSLDAYLTTDPKEESISWGELAELTHATQVEKFNFCTCEDNEGNENPYSDCPTSKPKEKTYGQTVLEGLPKDATIYSIIRRVSKSGMSRLIDFYVIKDNRPIWITPAVRDLIDYKQDKTTNALKVSGTGMDMCFHVVYSLGSAVHNDGYYFKSERM